MTAEQGTDELNLGLLCFIGARAVETRVLEALAAAGFDDITPSQGRIAARIGPITGPGSETSPSRRWSPSRQRRRPSTVSSARATYVGSRTPPTRAPDWW